MKVHLKVTALDRLVEKFISAQNEGREVDFVTVTPREYAELRHDLRCRTYISDDFSRAPNTDVLAYETRDFAIKPGSHKPQGSRWRVASHEKFMGRPLFVIPEWCVE